MQKTFELNPPMMPNYLTIKMPPGKRQEGLQELPKISVADLTEEEAEQYGQLMKDTFIQHCKAARDKTTFNK